MSGERDGWTVYVVRLSRKVLKHRKFRDANPQHDPRKPCVYVGLTFRTAAERFKQHKDGIRAAVFVKKYGVGVLDQHCKTSPADEPETS